MARYKPYDLNQTKMIPLSYADQIIERSFEYALNEIVEDHLDLSVFDHRYHNDATGRLAYDPKVLLKTLLYGYYRGIVSSRRIAEACCRNVVFMALSADSRPHFTTIASFVCKLEHEIASLFGDVLLYASALGLIGKEHFAVDGCKLPSNASKKWRGTHKELDEKRQKLERVAARIVQRHRERDGRECDDVGSSSEPENAPRYRKKIAEIKDFLAKNDKKRGMTGNERKSNLTDPESAKMTSSHGVIQGYSGLAVVNGHAQIVVHAEAHGSGYEARLLAPLIEATQKGEARESTESIKHREGPPPKPRTKYAGPTQRMQWKCDTPLGRELHSRRMGTVEPVFDNIQNKGMRRFTLRGQKKVNTPWKVFTMVHNIVKVAGVAKR